MPDRIYKVLFLCTGNSARSILAECVLNRLGKGRFQAFSAGSFPKGEVHPTALQLLKRENYPVDKLHSKSWDEFSGPDTPELDFVFTVCGNAANEICPTWSGGPISAHWGMPDPAAVSDDESENAFATTLHLLNKRITVFIDLPIDSLDKSDLQTQLNQIGRLKNEF